jgi:hypothetical protein
MIPEAMWVCKQSARSLGGPASSTSSGGSRR